jgi:hypothetical protein
MEFLSQKGVRQAKPAGLADETRTRKGVKRPGGNVDNEADRR